MVLQSRRARRLILAGSLLPIVYIPLFVLYVFGTASRMETGIPPDFSAMAAVFLAHFAVILISLVCIVFYAVHAAQNPALSDSQRAVWLLLVLLLPMPAHLVYWLMYLKSPPHHG